MVNNLKELYGEHFVQEDIRTDQEYYWFNNGKGDRFGIKKDKLSEREKGLLEMMYYSEDVKPMYQTKEEKAWSNFLFSEETDNNTEIEVPSKVRFIQFVFDKKIEEVDFKEAILEQFSKPILIWENDYSGVIIEKNDFQCLDYIEYSVDALASDFYSNLFVYIGSNLNDIGNLEALKCHFDLERAGFQQSRKAYPQRRIYKQSEFVAYALMENINNQGLLEFVQYMKNQINNDPEMRVSLFTYFECNLNVSLAAKKLYVHRNSLQYRIEKFYKNTGVDVRNFTEAVFIYLLLK